MALPALFLKEMGNPFSESSSDLVLDSRNSADSAIADAVFQIEKLNLDRYEAYLTGALEDDLL